MKAKKLLIIVLVFVLAFGFCACANEKSNTDNYQSNNEVYIEKQTNFLVTVIDNNGDAVEGVILQIRKDYRVTARTNKQGVAKFPMIVTNGYKLSILSCPEGYEYVGDTNIHIKQGISEYTLNITKK